MGGRAEGGGGRPGGRRAGLNGGPAGGARPPEGCGLKALPGGRAAPDKAGLGLGSAGNAVQGPGPSGVRTPGRPGWQLPGVRAAAPCSPWRRGRGHRFPDPAARSPARGVQRGDGATRALPGPPRPRHDEWASGARPRRKRAPPARPAKRAGTRPGAVPGPPGSPVRALGEGGRAGVCASSRASGKRRDPSPDYR